MISSLLALLLTAGEISPVGELESVAWGKQTGYLVGGDGASFRVSGPAKLLLTFAGEAKLKGTTLTVELLRDGQFLSNNALKLKAKKGAPKGYAVQAAVGVEVPAGEHTYKVKASAPALVSFAPTKQIARPLRAAAEADVSKGAPPPPAKPVEETETPEVVEVTPPTEPVVEEVRATAEHAANAMALGGSPVSEAGAPAGLQQAKRIAVYDLEVQEIAPTIGRVVTDSLVTELRKLQGISVIGMDEIRDMLSHEANKQILGCESNEACLAEIAGALGVDDLVTGKLSKVADSHVMLLRRIDQRNAKVAGSFDQRLTAGSGQEFLIAIGPAVEQLFADRPLRDGVQRGVAEEVALRLDPPPLPPWVFYATAGAAVLAGAAGGVFGLLANDAETQFNRMARGSGVIEGRDLVKLEDQANSRALGANIGYATAGGLAISAAIVFLFTDWHGYGTELKTPR